ncbi:MAG TPA: hypothetical protein VN931_07610 [Fibrobacteria bacterium]|nr:hypothetical protein [Fibrobacteria bacterium]
MRRGTGSAMPMVLFGMALALLIAAVGWTRAWTRRTESAHLCLAWQSRLLAESATACALQEAMARQIPTAKDSTTRDTTAKRRSTSVQDTADSTCGFLGPSPGTMSWEPAAGTQLLSVHARGSVLESGRPLVVELRSVWGGAPPPDPFTPALSLWDRNAGVPRLTGKVRGEVRLRADSAVPVGFVAQPSGGISEFVPSSLGSDTAAAMDRMAAAFRSEDAHLGGARFSPSDPPPDQDSLVYTIGDVVFDGPWTGDPWVPPGGRTLFVEGRVEFRGRMALDGWRIYARGPVVVQDEAALGSTDIFSQGGVQVSDKASVSGQILSKGSLVVSGNASLAAPSFAAVWPGKGADSIPRIEVRDRAAATAYLVALGGAAEIQLAPGADFRGVAVSGGLLRVEGTLHGVGVAGRVDCGLPGSNCSAGNFDRPSLPPDFAFPLGLPGNLGLRLVSWETTR